MKRPGGPSSCCNNGNGLMNRPDTLHLAHAAAGQFGSPSDGLTGSAKCDDPLMSCGVGYSTRKFVAGRLGPLNTLPLPLTPSFIIVSCHLKGKLQQEILNSI